MTRPSKLLSLMVDIKNCLDSGRYLDTSHSSARQKERQITRPEILFVLNHGHHEKKKDKLDEQHLVWNYSIRGKTLDKRELRIIVSFEKNGLLIITAIELR